MKNIAFKPNDAAIILVDHQPGVIAMAQSVPSAQLTANAAVLAALGNDLEIPHLITTTRETLEFLGTTAQPIQDAAPDAYEARIRRPGTLNAFHEPAFAKAVKATGRRNLIMAGATTDVCLYHAVVSALEAGYAVKVVADASGSSSTLADTVTYARLRELGAVITTTYGILFELFPDLGKPEGQRAEAIAARSVVPS